MFQKPTHREARARANRQEEVSAFLQVQPHNGNVFRSRAINSRDMQLDGVDASNNQRVYGEVGTVHKDGSREDAQTIRSKKLIKN